MHFKAADIFKELYLMAFTVFAFAWRWGVKSYFPTVDHENTPKHLEQTLNFTCDIFKLFLGFFLPIFSNCHESTMQKRLHTFLYSIS